MTKCAAISAIFPVTIIPFSSCTDKQKKSKNEEEAMIVCENSARKKEMKVKYIENEIKNRNLIRFSKNEGVKYRIEHNKKIVLVTTKSASVMKL